MSEAVFREALRLHQAGDVMSAGPLYERVLRDNPRHFQALYLLGFIQYQLGRFEDAQRIIGQAIQLNPNVPDAHYNRACALQKLRRDEEALSAFDAALRINPNLVDALFNRAVSLLTLRRYSEALAASDAVLQHNPGDAQSWHNRGGTLVFLQRFREAAGSFEKALALAPDIENTRGPLLYCRLQNCEWGDFNSMREAIARDIRAGKRAAAPLENLLASTSPEDQARCATIWTERECPTPFAPLSGGARAGRTRLRIAYVSADFRFHPVARQIAGVLERHDKTRFEIIAVSYGADDSSALRGRIRDASETFFDARGQSDAEIAAELRRREVNIAVDLTGHTTDGRIGIFARRPAPIQVNYLGFPGTLGAPYYDYIIADRHVIAEDENRFYAEKIARLPHGFFPVGDKRGMGVSTSRAEHGLPENAFVFCSFNTICKLTPETFAAWIRILKAVENSVLWLPDPKDIAKDNLRREAEARGIAPERILFAPFAPNPEAHLARLSLADLFLDTWPFGAHSTASDALWAGVPVLTYRGETFGSRVAASLLHALGVPELVTHSHASYEALAVRLAKDRSALSALRATLARNRDAAPLFDTARYTKDLETAFAMMWECHERGVPPSDITVLASAP